jgi:hypothetical protein
VPTGSARVERDARFPEAVHPRAGGALADISAAGSRDHDVAAPAERALPAGSLKAAADGCRPVALRLAVPAVSVAEDCHHHRSAGHGAAVASVGLPALLALEVSFRGGRPKVPLEARSLIRRMSMENPLWARRRAGHRLLHFDRAAHGIDHA